MIHVNQNKKRVLDMTSIKIQKYTEGYDGSLR